MNQTAPISSIPFCHVINRALTERVQIGGYWSILFCLLIEVGDFSVHVLWTSGLEIGKKYDLASFYFGQQL
jgi:hypothetical protein